MQSKSYNDAVNDPARLAALDALAILDTPPEQSFDDIVRLATRLCAAPVALVSLVSADRQWFKARIGFPPCETDLDRSVCKFALVEPDLLVVPDLADDPRTAANPLVTGEPRIRFYAGAPLRLPDGQVIGSLCVIDTKPRPGGLTEEQADDLRALGRQASAQLSMRRAVEHRELALARHSAILRQAWRLDVLAKASTALLVADDPAAVLEPILADGAEVLGFDRAYIYDVMPDRRHLRLTHAVNATLQAREHLRHMPFGSPLCGIVAETGRPLLLAGLQDDTYPEFAQARAFGLNAYAGFPVTSRGELCAVISFASTQVPTFDAEALSFFETLARLMSAVYERLDSEADLAETGAYWRSLFERLSEGFIVGEVVRDRAGKIADWRFVEINHAWSDLTGVDARDALGKTVREVFPGIEDAWVEDLAKVVVTGEPVMFLRPIEALDRWYEGSAFAVGPERFAVVFLEVTSRIQTERERRLLNEELSHRLKNSLAMVLSIATYTLRGVADRAPVEAFQQRIHALSSAHDVLLRQNWTAASIKDVVAAVAAGVGHSDRIDVAGPDLDLGPRATLSLSLLLHELATNAAKYGALSTSEGRVAVTWRLEGTDEAAEVVLEWEERGGPPPIPPASKGRVGFGSRLIGMGLAGTGGVDLRYPPTGFQATMRAPLVQLQRS